jgi:hypothetical protein
MRMWAVVYSLVACMVLASSLLSVFGIALVGANLVADWLGKRSDTAAWLPALCQCIGIFCALMGFTFRSVALVSFAGLLLALRLALSSKGENSLPQMAETAILAAALFTLGSLAIVRGFSVL